MPLSTCRRKKSLLAMISSNCRNSIRGLRRTRSESALYATRNLVVERSFFYSQFEVEGSQYHPGDRDIGDLNQKVKELAASQTGMKKKINPTVMNMIDT